MDKIKNSLFMKLILLVMLIIILPSIVSNVIAYRQNYHMIQQQIIDWNESIMQIGMEETINYIREIEQAPMNLFENPDVVRILNQKTDFTDMERYVIRKYGKAVSDRASAIFRVVINCKNGEIIDGVYASDQTRIQIGRYHYPERNTDTFQVGRDEEGNPAFLIYNVDIQNVPAYNTITSMRICADLEELKNMSKTLCGQYEDSIVMVSLGKDGKELAYTSSFFQETDYDEKVLIEKRYVKGKLDGAEGMFF